MTPLDPETLEAVLRRLALRADQAQRCGEQALHVALLLVVADLHELAAERGLVLFPPTRGAA